MELYCYFNRNSDHMVEPLTVNVPIKKKNLLTLTFFVILSFLFFLLKVSGIQSLKANEWLCVCVLEA